MKITGIKIHIVKMGREFHFSADGRFSAEPGLVRFFTDEGIEGNADFCKWAVPPKLLAETTRIH